MTCPCRASSCLAWLAFVAPIHAATGPEATPKRLQLQINGLKPALESAVLSGLTLQQYRDRSVSDAQLRRLLSLGEAEIRATLEAWGYYDGKVSSHMEDAPEGRYRAWFDVAPGTPILVKSSEVSVSGDAAQVPAVASALKAFVPKCGRTLRSHPVRVEQGSHRHGAHRPRIPRRPTHHTPRRGDYRHSLGAHRAQMGQRSALYLRSHHFHGRPVFRGIPPAVSPVEARRGLLERRRARPATSPGRCRLLRNRHRHAAPGKSRGACRSDRGVAVGRQARHLQRGAVCQRDGAWACSSAYGAADSTRGPKGHAELDFAQRLQSLELELSHAPARGRAARARLRRHLQRRNHRSQACRRPRKS